MRAKPIPIEKQDVARLGNDELKSLVDWGSHKGFKAIEKVKDDALKRLMNESIADDKMSDEDGVETLKQMAYLSHALTFLLDASERAKAELKRRDDA